MTDYIKKTVKGVTPDEANDVLEGKAFSFENQQFVQFCIINKLVVSKFALKITPVFCWHFATMVLHLNLDLLSSCTKIICTSS